MKTNFTHWIVYVTAALSTLASLNPAIVAAVVGPTIGVYAVPVIGLASALVAFLHSVAPASSTTTTSTTTTTPPAATPSTASSTTTTTTKQSGFARSGMLICIATALLTILGGCAALESFFGSPTGATVVSAAVDIAVATAESKGVSASEINKIAKAALVADSSTAATVATIMAAVNAAVAKAHLPAGDQTAILIVEAALDAAIQAKISGSASVAAAQVAIADVLSPVIAATGG